MASDKRLVKTSYDCYECIVDDVEELIVMMFQAVSRYARKLDAKIRNSEGYMECLNQFNDRYRTFFSNYRQTTATKAMVWEKGIELHLEFTYRIGRVKLKMMEEETQKEVESISKLLFEPDMPKEAKIVLAHNYLIHTVIYLKDHKDPLATSYTQSAYGALVEKKCVCQGFAEAYKRLMDAAGVDCTVVVGDIEGYDAPHAWNTVSLGQVDNTYHVDVTWDNNDSNIPKYTYFCKKDQFFEDSRTWKRSVTPSCPAMKDVMLIARAYINGHREQLLAKGISPYVLFLDEKQKLIQLEKNLYACTVDNFDELLQIMYTAAGKNIQQLIVRVRDKERYMDCLKEFGVRYRKKLPNYSSVSTKDNRWWENGIELHFFFTYKNVK